MLGRPPPHGVPQPGPSPPSALSMLLLNGQTSGLQQQRVPEHADFPSLGGRVLPPQHHQQEFGGGLNFGLVAQRGGGGVGNLSQQHQQLPQHLFGSNHSGMLLHGQGNNDHHLDNGSSFAPPPIQSKEDFPALPSGGGGGGAPSIPSSSSSLLPLSFSKLASAPPPPQQSQPPPPPPPQQQQQQSRTGNYGLQGLMSVIRMEDPDRGTLALGTDLTTLGLNLNSSESLHAMFISPWSDDVTNPNGTSATREPPFALNPHFPQTNVVRPEIFEKLQIETLFVCFYSMPRDVVQALAANELMNRGWRLHEELRLWFSSTKNGAVVFYDLHAWERRIFTGQLPKGFESGFMQPEVIVAAARAAHQHLAAQQQQQQHASSTPQISSTQQGGS